MTSGHTSGKTGWWHLVLVSGTAVASSSWSSLSGLSSLLHSGSEETFALVISFNTLLAISFMRPLLFLRHISLNFFYSVRSFTDKLLRINLWNSWGWWTCYQSVTLFLLFIPPASCNYFCRSYILQKVSGSRESCISSVLCLSWLKSLGIKKKNPLVFLAHPAAPCSAPIFPSCFSSKIWSCSSGFLPWSYITVGWRITI